MELNLKQIFFFIVFVHHGSIRWHILDDVLIWLWKHHRHTHTRKRIKRMRILGRKKNKFNEKKILTTSNWHGENGVNLFCYFFPNWISLSSNRNEIVFFLVIHTRCVVVCKTTTRNYFFIFFGFVHPLIYWSKKVHEFISFQKSIESIIQFSVNKCE